MVKCSTCEAYKNVLVTQRYLVRAKCLCSDEEVEVALGLLLS